MYEIKQLILAASVLMMLAVYVNQTRPLRAKKTPKKRGATRNASGARLQTNPANDSTQHTKMHD